MKDKRLELKLSVRGDGSLSRTSSRSSNRSNRNVGLPVSEFFAIDRFSNPYDRPIDVIRKYSKHTANNPTQSLNNLHEYYDRDDSRSIRYASRGHLIPYEQYESRVRHYVIPEHQYPENHHPYGESRSRIGHYDEDSDLRYASLPRSLLKQVEYPVESSAGNYTLPSRKTPRRVRISEVQPTIHDYGKAFNLQIGYGYTFKFIFS